MKGDGAICHNRGKEGCCGLCSMQCAAQEIHGEAPHFTAAACTEAVAAARSSHVNDFEPRARAPRWRRCNRHASASDDHITNPHIEAARERQLHHSVFPLAVVDRNGAESVSVRSKIEVGCVPVDYCAAWDGAAMSCECDD